MLNKKNGKKLKNIYINCKMFNVIYSTRIDSTSAQRTYTVWTFVQILDCWFSFKWDTRILGICSKKSLIKKKKEKRKNKTFKMLDLFLMWFTPH